MSESVIVIFFAVLMILGAFGVALSLVLSSSNAETSSSVAPVESCQHHCANCYTPLQSAPEKK